MASPQPVKYDIASIEDMQLFTEVHPNYPVNEQDVHVARAGDTLVAYRIAPGFSVVAEAAVPTESIWNSDVQSLLRQEAEVWSAQVIGYKR